MKSYWEAVVRDKCLWKMKQTDTSLKQKFSESNGCTGTVLQGYSSGDKSLEHKLQCSTLVIDHKCLRDSSLRNKLPSTASLMHHSPLENQHSRNMLSNDASSLQHSPRDTSLDSGTIIRHNAIGASFSDNSYIISHSQTSCHLRETPSDNRHSSSPLLLKIVRHQAC